MFDPAVLLSFIAAGIVIIIAPGPAQALVLSRTIGSGRKAGILTVLGVNSAMIVQAPAAALGLSAILATSSLLYSIIKYLGAAYLIYLGIQSLLSKNAQIEEVQSSGSQFFTKAFITGALNPKVTLFFLAFVPHFIDPQRGMVFWQFVILGAVLSALDIVYESILVLIASAMISRIKQSPWINIWRQRLTGVVLIGLGINAALSEKE